MYVGVTNDLECRINEHKSKMIDGFTKKYNVNRLVYYETTTDISTALDREKQIKKWRRAKKNELVKKMNPEWRDPIKNGR